MSRLTINKLTILYFKGIKFLEVQMDGSNMEIIAENGVGKTTVEDAFLWALFGKDSTGRTDSGVSGFKIHPLDPYNKPYQGVVTVVEALITLDGAKHVFRRELQEKIVKKQLTGYTTICTVDGVPKLLKEYQAFVDAIVSENIFKLLTDIWCFSEKLHWLERRKVLLDVAGDIPPVEGFTELLEAACDLPLEDFKKKINNEKKAYVKERVGINPRCDELLLGLTGSDTPTGTVENDRDNIWKAMAALKEQRTGILASEKERQEKIIEKNGLIALQNQRVNAIKNDPTRTQKLVDEKAAITLKHSNENQVLAEAEAELRQAVTAKNGLQAQADSEQSVIENIRKEQKGAEAETVDTICYACDQPLSEERVSDVTKKRSEKIEEIKAKGKEHLVEFEELLKKLEEAKKLRFDLEQTVQHGKGLLEESRNAMAVRTKEIDESILALPEPVVEEDATWIELDSQIQKIDSELGEPVTEQLTAIEKKLSDYDQSLVDCNNVLAQADRMKRDRERLQELKAREEELAQLIADIEKLLNDLDEYKMAESKLITDAVNSKFKVVNFKLFDVRLNEGIKECCEPMLKGIPQSDMSFGQKIFCGNDIINTLSEHYKMCVPLFIDHAESVTYPIETKAQTIKLIAKPGEEELVIKKAV